MNFYLKVFYATRHSTQESRKFSSSQAGEGKGGATQDYEKDNKVGPDIGMGTYEYKKGRQDEVRCRAWEGVGGSAVGSKADWE